MRCLQPLKNIAEDEVATMMEIVASIESSRLFKKIVHFGYYWPTMQANAMSFACK